MECIKNIQVNYEIDKHVRKTAEEMDEQRQKTLAYEYLCHLEEAKKWMEACLRENLPPTTELEENLRNGIYLAKLGHFMAPEILPLNKIYDIEQKRYAVAGLQFRHTDNINHFLKCLKSMQLPLTFQPETTDIYDKKNMPRVIYCIHALSTHLFKLGKAPQIQDLYGKVSFTDEEINAVSKELKKYNIQMPAFQKIGGLLTTNMEGDTAALHAAIIAINQSLSTRDTKAILTQLQNNAARLKNIKTSNIKYYYDTLSEAKESKAQAALNRSLNDSYVPDAYDELLTQAEIQGHINSVNVLRALEVIVESIFCGKDQLVSALKDPALKVQNICYENSEIYKEKLIKLVEKFDWQENFQYQQKALQEAIDEANDIASKALKREEAVQELNKALEKENLQEFNKVLMNPNLGLSDNIDEFAIPLYYEEMKIDCIESKKSVSYSDIVVSIRVLSAIANVTKAIDTGNPELTYQALTNPEAHIMELEEENKVKYFRALTAVRCEKQFSGEDCLLLTYNDIQESIDVVNQKCLNDDEVIQVLGQLNTAVIENNREGVVTALQATSLKLKKPVSFADTSLYMKLFKKCLSEKHSDGSELWLEDIEEVAEKVASEAKNVQSACALLTQINKGLQKKNFIFTMNWLKTIGLQILENKRPKYFEALSNLHKMKKEKYTCPYVRYITPGDNESYLDLKNFSYTWDNPKNITESCFVTHEDVQSVVKEVNNESSRDQPVENIQEMITKFQAHIRGYLLRKNISDRFTHFYNNIEMVKKIQTWWRGILQCRHYAKLLKKKLEKGQGEMYKISSVKDKNQSTMEWYKEQEDKVIKIQALWRGRAARKAFHSLLRLDKPPLSVVRRFSAILNFNTEDYDKDLQLQQSKNEVVQLIRHNQNLSQQLDSMDIKIGLLIQNRITLQDVVAHGKNLESLAKSKNSHRVRKNSVTETTHKGLKSLTKEGRRMLEGYQHLFYLLQTNPNYLSKLLFLLPQSKSNKFLQNVILTLFNFGSNIREEYLLLKLLGTALQEEIRCKFDKPSEVVTGNPLVLKMAVNYARQLNGQRALRQLLGPIIEKILSDKTINIETNPVDIYKCWRNQLEMETGETLDLPYTVTHQQALQYDQVRKRLNNGIKLLQSTVKELLTRITESRKLIPYGMLYMAKVLNKTLTEKFPNAPEKDILKVIGNLIYYHFINAAIVAPDAFDIISLPVDRSLSNDQRRNLASIAKILQFAASKKGFGDEATHLVCLNPFIIECHEKFKNFFRFCCQIEELEDYFSIHEYTEATMIHKPEIYISLQEICDTHQLVLEYQDEIAPDPLDPLHELLEDLGSAPTVASLLGITDTTSEANMSRYGKTEVCLTLTNKFEVPENDDTNLNKLFIKTKELLVSVLRFLKGNTLIEALELTFSSPIQEKLYDIQYSSTIPALNVVHDSFSLNDCKLQLRSYLKKLELGGWVSKKDGYQNVVTAVAKDLCNKGKYRFLRNKQLQTLRFTKQRLEEKSNYYKEQVEYYNQYIQRCLENLHTGKGSLHAIKMGQKENHRKLKSRMTLKYSGTKLQEKGVLLEIEGLPQSQFKNVTFEISPTEQNGVFTVKGKFMGVEMEKIDIDIQKLLELQFEGAPIMDMFGKARVNVNLLLFLLNRKFYRKT